MKMRVQSLASLSGSGARVAMSCGVGRRCSSDPVLLWLWPAATALIRPLAWEPPYAAGVAQEMAKRQKKQKKTPTVREDFMCMLVFTLPHNSSLFSEPF